MVEEVASTPSVNATPIGSAVEHGAVPGGAEVDAFPDGHVITLPGPVTWHYQREAAERGVHYLKAATGVFDKIAMKPPTSAAGLKSAIRTAAVRNARPAPGVTAVVNHLQVVI